MYPIFEKFSDYVSDIQKGKLYCNNLNYFKNLANNNNGIADKNEGIITITDKIKTKYKLYITNITIEVDENSNFLFCIYTNNAAQAISKQITYIHNDYEYIKLKNLNYDKVIAIYNTDKFISKILSNCQIHNIKCIHGYVKYLDIHNISNKIKKDLNMAPYLSAFIKDQRYSWQNEYRFLFYNVPSEMIDKNHFILDINDITNISKICRLEDFSFINFLGKKNLLQ